MTPWNLEVLDKALRASWVGDVHHGGEQHGFHWWNQLPSGVELDLTREQFRDGQTVTAARVVKRPPGPLPRRWEEYLLLRERVGRHLGHLPAPAAHAGTSKRTNVYVDMVGDLFHPGHVALLKRQPVMTLAERVAVVEACRYVDAVIPNAPEHVTTEFLDDHDIAVVVHGDDLSPEALEEVFGPVAAAGKLQLVEYTAGVSTTDLIRRCLERGVAQAPVPEA